MPCGKGSLRRLLEFGDGTREARRELAVQKAVSAVFPECGQVTCAWSSTAPLAGMGSASFRQAVPFHASVTWVPRVLGFTASSRPRQAEAEEHEVWLSPRTYTLNVIPGRGPGTVPPGTGRRPRGGATGQAHEPSREYSQSGQGEYAHRRPPAFGAAFRRLLNDRCLGHSGRVRCPRVTSAAPRRGGKCDLKGVRALRVHWESRLKRHGPLHHARVWWLILTGTSSAAERRARMMIL